MRAIAEAACDLVRRFKGSHSGEHGDGISRSEFHERMFGPRLVRAFEAVKDGFDPEGRLNPGKIVRPYAMDDRLCCASRTAMRATEPVRPALDWSDWGGFGGRSRCATTTAPAGSLAGGAMCPSYRATRDEQHVTRGRANAAARHLRPARAGRLHLARNEGAIDSASLQGLPPRVPDRRRHGEDEDRVPAPLPRPPRPAAAGTADRPSAALRPVAALAAPLLNLRDRIPRLSLGDGALARPLGPPHPAALAAALARGRPDRRPGGRARRRPRPRAVRRHLQPRLRAREPRGGGAGSAARRLPAARRRPAAGGARSAAGAPISPPASSTRRGARRRGRCGPRPLRRPRRPRRRARAVLPSSPSATNSPRCCRARGRGAGGAAHLFEEVLAADLAAGRIALPLRRPRRPHGAHLHGHCHQKAFGAMARRRVGARRACPG